jgi:Integrase core domain
VRAAVQPIPLPKRKFPHVHVDLVGLLPCTAGGHTYIFTMMDRSTRWMEAIPIADIKATTCAAVLIREWVARYGVPDAITSDRGKQFVSEVWSSTCQQMGIEVKLTTAYHPQAEANWDLHLPLVLLGLRAVPKDDKKVQQQKWFSARSSLYLESCLGHRRRIGSS